MKNGFPSRIYGSAKKWEEETGGKMIQRRKDNGMCFFGRRRRNVWGGDKRSSSSSVYISTSPSSSSSFLFIRLSHQKTSKAEQRHVRVTFHGAPPYHRSRGKRNGVHAIGGGRATPRKREKWVSEGWETQNRLPTAGVQSNVT